MTGVAWNGLACDGARLLYAPIGQALRASRTVGRVPVYPLCTSSSTQNLHLRERAEMRKIPAGLHDNEVGIEPTEDIGNARSTVKRSSSDVNRRPEFELVGAPNRQPCMVSSGAPTSTKANWRVAAVRL
jgi:hypothetical protein